MSKKKGLLLYGCYVVLTLSVVLIVLYHHGVGIFPSGADGKNAYAELLELRRILISSIGKRQFAFWSWNIGLGADTIGSLGKLLFNPFNYCIVFSRVKNLEYVYLAVTFIQCVLSGLSLYWFLGNQKSCKKNYKLYLSSAYFFITVCTLFAGIPFAVYSMLLCPLYLKLAEKKTTIFNSILLIVVGTLFALDNVVIFVFTIFIVYYRNRGNGEKLKNEWGKILSVCTAILISSISWLPQIKIWLESDKSSIIDFLVKQMKTFISQSEGLGLFLLVVVLMLPILFNRSLKNKLIVAANWLAICLILSIIGRPGTYLGILFAFFTVTSTQYGIMLKREFTNISCIILVSSVLLGLFTSADVINIILLCAILTMFLIYCLSKSGTVLTQGKISRESLGLFVCILFSFLILAVIVNGGQIGLGNKYSDYASVYNSIVQKNSLDIDDQSFYREEILGDEMQDEVVPIESYNYGMLYGSKGIWSNSLTQNRKINQFYSELNVNTVNQSYSNISGNDQRTVLNYLLGVKYLNIDLTKEIDKVKNTKSYRPYCYSKQTKNKNMARYKNKYSIGLGTVYSKYLLKDEYDKMSPLDRQQALLESAVVEKKDVKSLSISNYDLNSVQKNIDFNLVYEEACELNKNSIEAKPTERKTARFRLNIGSVEKSEIYVVFKNLKCTNPDDFDVLCAMSSRRKHLRKTENTASKMIGNDYYLNMGYFEQFNGLVYFEMFDENKYTFDDFKIIRVPMDKYEEAARQGVDNRLHLGRLSSQGFYGKVNTKTGGIMFLSIPNVEGWKIDIDGKRVPTFSVDTAFLGTKIGAGNHSVRGNYIPRYIRVYKIMLFIAIVLIALQEIILILCYVRGEKRTNENNKKKD